MIVFLLSCSMGLLSWNLNGYRSHFEELQLLSVDHKPPKASIPQSSGTARHPPVPWWNPDCAVAIRARKRALTLLQHHPTMDNLINYKRLRSRARRVVRDSKKSSWRAYISSLTHHTSSWDVWHKVRKIKGTCSPCTISGLLIHGSIKQRQVLLSANWHLILPVCLVLIIIVHLFNLLR